MPNCGNTHDNAGVKLDPEAFEKLVWTAYDALPEPIRSRVNNLELQIKEQPDPFELDLSGGGNADDLFGFYEGTPLPERAFGYDMTVPDVVYIYQRAHELECDTLDAMRAEVTRTLRHELAHHFGIDDDRLDALGAY
jgi:predicted Zn-dependent protease with MMP-like domain